MSDWWEVLDAVLHDVAREAEHAEWTHGPFHSEHEAYAVLLEEVEEYWAEVKKEPAARDAAQRYHELVQVAAVATLAAMRQPGALASALDRERLERERESSSVIRGGTP